MTSGLDALLAVFAALTDAEQDEAIRLLRERRLISAIKEAGETSRFLEALLTVSQEVGRIPTVDDYRTTWKNLKASGIDLPNATTLITHFGSWRRAKEALSLSSETTSAKIDARFRARRADKVHRYRLKTLRETLIRCARDLGHVPLVADFKAWRDRELELAHARGDHTFRLPSDSPYRRRFGSWEKALLHFGFQEDEVEARLDLGQRVARENLAPHQFRATAASSTTRTDLPRPRPPHIE